jgi:hypothetical protein
MSATHAVKKLRQPAVAPTTILHTYRHWTLDGASGSHTSLKGSLICSDILGLTFSSQETMSALHWRSACKVNTRQPLSVAETRQLWRVAWSDAETVVELILPGLPRAFWPGGVHARLCSYIRNTQMVWCLGGGVAKGTDAVVAVDKDRPNCRNNQGKAGVALVSGGV